MSIHYNVTGKERKALVEAICDFLSLEAVYKGAPTFAYEIGNLTVDKNGTLSFQPDVDAYDGDLKPLADALKERGFVGESDETPYEEGSDDPESESDDDRLEIEFPREGFSDEALENLRKIIASKDTLIKKALGLDDSLFSEDILSFEVTDDTIRFPWFTLTGADGEADAYARFICALCEMAKKQKRVTAKEKDVENDKFTMRLFLIRLGFIGPEYKAARHIFLKNLTGNSSWKSGQPPAKTAENTDSGSDDAAHEAEATADAQSVSETDASMESQDTEEV